MGFLSRVNGLIRGQNPINDFYGHLEHSVNAHNAGINQVGVIGGFERGFGSVLIAVIPLDKLSEYRFKCDVLAVTDQFCMAALGAYFRRGIDIKFNIGIGANDRANIAPVQHGALCGEIALECQERGSDFRMDSDFGRRGADRAAFKDGIRQVFRSEFCCGFCPVRGIGNIITRLHDSMSGRPVKFSRIKIVQIIMRGEALAERAFAAGKCAVYSDNGHDILAPIEDISSKKLGKLVAIIEASSIVTGASAPSPKISADMAMRWS